MQELELLLAVSVSPALCELVDGTLTVNSPVVFLFATYNTSLKTGET